MSNFTDFFPAPGGGGGGGLTPKFEEFNSSGTFTPTQALIDAGGYIDIFIVGAGSRNQSEPNGNGGEVRFKKMYLTSTSAITVTIGAGGASNGNAGGDSAFLGSSAGGVDITARGGQIGNWTLRHGAGWGSSSVSSPVGSGVLGYGAGATTGYGGVYNAGPNTGQGTAYFPGGSGYCLIKWYE